jgi:ubiquinone/menaquinone biosynthesis C-methylase UbiE/ADP-ribose pyrophosphatase YjhB (NUDIX family)
MPDLMSAMLLEKNERALVAHRRRPPFAGQWMLPSTLVRDDEAAEDALRRHARDQFGLTLVEGDETFADTVYITDSADEHQYVANIFRAVLPAGPMRFNAEGDYDDARWLGAGDLDGVTMPPDLRIPLAKILTDPEGMHTLDWDQMGKELTAQAVPLAEREALASARPAVAPDTPPPDVGVGWDAISKAYQEEIFGDRFGTALMWSWSLSEDDLHLLEGVAGKRALVLGCGGGQDVVALEKLGAIAVGIDASSKQIEYARKYAQRHDAVNASFVEGTVEDLSRFDDASFDMAVSAHMLNYVERIEDTLRETARILKSGSAFVLSVRHPFDAVTGDDPPYRVERPYWAQQRDWTWQIGGASAEFRQWFWTISEWVDMIQAAGFSVEQLLEPQEQPAQAVNDDGAKKRLVPYTLIIKARKR